MKKRKFHQVYELLIIVLSTFSIEITAAEFPSNTLTSSGIPIKLEHWQIAKDTEPKKSLPYIADSLWKLLGPGINENLYTRGNWILRTNLIIPDSINEKTIWGLFPNNFITAYEIYWDGTKIGQNGIMGLNKDDEKAGTFNYSLGLFPNLVTAGKHTIIIRLSNYHNYSSWKWYYADLVIGRYDSLLKKIFQSGYHAFFISGILFIAFLFNLFLYFKRQRKTEHLLFSLICFQVILDFLTAQAALIFTLPTTYIHFEYYFYRLNTLLFTILFPTFFISSFSLPKKTIGIILTVPIIIFFFFTNMWNIFGRLSLNVLVLSSAIAIWALRLKREGSLIISIGLALSWVSYFFNLAFEGLATIMVICTSFSIAQQFARKEKSEREAQLRSTNLENELLKKNINPHFILNTLTSIIVWLRRDSNSAIKLIEALAEEFRMINQISSFKQIPITQEIELCKAHLKIMNYRKGADYKMETQDIDEKDTIPPMIFHTLIENGLTHGYETQTTGTFTLERKKNSDCVQYILSNDGDFSCDESKDSSGFGIRYIKGRLEESYHNRWEFISHKQEHGWESIIIIKDK